MKRAALLSAGLCLALVQTAYADKTSGTIYYTTFNGGANVHSVDYNFDGLTTFSLTKRTNIASLGGADGIIFAPNGDLLVGGQTSNAVFEITKTGTKVGTYTSNHGQYHLALFPDNTHFFAGNLPGNLTVHTLGSFTKTIGQGIKGGDTTITSLAFAGNKAFYATSGGGAGTGDFGTIDLATLTTTQIYSNHLGFHGLVFDPFSKDLIAFAGTTILQIDPSNDAILASRTLAGEDFDQGTTDGKGHLLVASNLGNLTFLDYTSTGLIGNAGDFVSTQFLANSLDDVAPLAGLGSSAVPEPGAYALLLSMVLTGAGFLARRRKQADKAP